MTWNSSLRHKALHALWKVVSVSPAHVKTWKQHLSRHCSCWLASRKRHLLKKKLGVRAHGWLLDPVTTFSLMRKRWCSLHSYFLPPLYIGASEKPSARQPPVWLQHLWPRFDKKLVDKISDGGLSEGCFTSLTSGFTQLVQEHLMMWCYHV